MPPDDHSSAPHRRRRTYMRGSSSPARIFSAERSARALLALLIVGAPLLIGGVYPWAVVTIAAVALASLGASLLASRATAKHPAPLVAFAICGAAAWTAIQATPLPCDLVRWLAPESVTATHAALAPLRGPVPACTLTRAPGATHEEILKGVAIVAAFLSAWLVSVSGGRRAVITMVAYSTLVMSSVALGHGLLGLDRVFGIYSPVEIRDPPLVAPLVNMNNLGGFAALGTPIWIAFAWRENIPTKKLLCYVAIALTSATAVLSLSRGGIGQLLAGTAAVLMIGRRRVSSHRGLRLFVAGRQVALVVSIAMGIGLSAYAVSDVLLAEIDRSDVSKLLLLWRSFQFALDHAWVGVGRGAFSSTFVGVEGSTTRFAYAENFILQWMCEWGIVATAVLLAAIGLALARGFRDQGSLVRVGMAVGLVAFAAQNMVDLAFELLGVAVVAATALASVIATGSRRARRSAQAPQPLEPSVAHVSKAWLMLGTLTLIVLGPRIGRESTSALEARLRAGLGRAAASDFDRTLLTALRLYPSEPTFPVLAAADALARHDAAAGRWVNRSLQLAPGWAAPHIQAYEWVAWHGNRSQALLELRAAAQIDALAVRNIACHLAREDSSVVLDIAPRSGPMRGVYFANVVPCVPINDPRAEAIDAVWGGDVPTADPPYARQAWRLARRGDVAGAIAVTDRMARVPGLRQRAGVVRADVFMTAQRWQEAAQASETALANADENSRRPLLSMLARAEAHLHDRAASLAAVLKLRRLAAVDAGQLADTHALEAEVYLIIGDSGLAYREFREAYRINQDTKHLLRLASLAEQLGDPGQALWAYMQLCEQDPTHTDNCLRRDQLLQAASTSPR